ncbi:zinc finger protein 345-like [Macrobrachium nipponense]|uniref:zinc finger protein 345-like n=1 Tax=Macrobrachium nipponense TaxID=159736 RepID=UPI0030C7C1B7
MVEICEALQLFKQKIQDVVKVAHQISEDDQKVAQELWAEAYEEIQDIWKSNSFAQGNTIQDVNNERQEQRCREEKENRVHIEKEGIEVHCIEEIKKENTENTADLLGSGIGSGHEVQSVHLMISADPGLISGMNSFRKAESRSKSESEFKCKICMKGFRSALALRKHMSVHKNESNLDLEKQPLQSHKGKVKFASDDRPFKCGHCSSAFKTRGNLVRHKATHTGDKPWECSLCGKSYTEKRSLTVHMRTHTGERPYKCGHCSSAFKTRGNLVRHKATHTGDKPWECSLCGKSYTEKRSLTVHMRTHTGERPYMCTICHKRFTQSGVLQTHMLTHSDKFAHLCDICGRSFRQRSQLVTHRRRHQGIRPFACSECESKFTTKGDFDRHLRTHTGERPHHCDVCGSSFARAQTLQEHKNRHFNFKPYICKICGKSFYELTACSRHIKSTHGRDGSNASPSDNIIRSSSARAYQDEIKERRNEEITPLSKEDQTKFITVHDEKIEIIEASEQTTINDRYPSQNTKLVCKDCGSSFSSYKGLNAHGRYCKHKKKNNYEAEPNPRLSTKITARLPGVPVTQWLAEHTASYSSINQGDDLDESESSKSKGDCTAEETCEPVEYIQEIEDSSVSHAVSIDEDGSITSLPLSQLAPIHIQLESDYMVVLSNGSRVQDGASTSFQERDIHQVEVDEQSHSISEEEASEQRITLVLNP